MNCLGAKRCGIEDFTARSWEPFFSNKIAANLESVPKIEFWGQIPDFMILNPGGDLQSMMALK
jgi:hypothetical protein